MAFGWSSGRTGLSSLQVAQSAMRHHAWDRAFSCCRRLRLSRMSAWNADRRSVHISTTSHSTTSPLLDTESTSLAISNHSADARFEILGTPFSLLSASISPSQNLYTRKGTLVGFNGRAEHAISTLSLLGPFRRALLGIPFVYQRITSTSPYNALIATKSPITSLVIVHLDGRSDWMISQRNALLAWTGHTLSLKPRWNLQTGVAGWGATAVTGRGLLALCGKGLIHQIMLKPGEEYVVHPSNVVAYSTMKNGPQPYRFKMSSLRLQIPNTSSLLPDTRFWRTMRESVIWRFVNSAAFTARTWLRRTVWGDRLFLQFQGPATILIQSRAAAITESLTAQDVNEIADSPAGAIPAAIHAKNAVEPGKSGTPVLSSESKQSSISYASVGRDGKVKFDGP